MRIYVVRHGVAEPRNEGADDGERRLTEKGMRRTKAAARGLRAIGVRPAILLSSPLRRAQETAAIVASALPEVPSVIQTSEYLLPDAPPARLLEELAGLDADEVMCFGHAPHLDQVIALALGADGAVTSLGKAGAACLEIEGFGPPSATVEWICRPKMLRRLGKRRRRDR